jgi:hypothetical protein
MTEQEIKSIEALRGSVSKSTLRYIYSVFDAHNGTKNTNCWCSGSVRKKYAMQFFVWFDEQVKNNK